MRSRLALPWTVLLLPALAVACGGSPEAGDALALRLEIAADGQFSLVHAAGGAALAASRSAEDGLGSPLAADDRLRNALLAAAADPTPRANDGVSLLTLEVVAPEDAPWRWVARCLRIADDKEIRVRAVALRVAGAPVSAERARLEPLLAETPGFDPKEPGRSVPLGYRAPERAVYFVRLARRVGGGSSRPSTDMSVCGEDLTSAPTVGAAPRTDPVFGAVEGCIARAVRGGAALEAELEVQPSRREEVPFGDVVRAAQAARRGGATGIRIALE